MPFQVHAGHIAAQAGGYEPQRTNNYSVRITGLSGFNGGTDVIELSLATFDPPSRNIATVPIPFGNEEGKGMVS